MERLKQLRKEKKLTQTEMAARLGVGRTTYSAYENGTIEAPYKRLAVLAEMFGASVEYLTGESEHRSVFDAWDAEHDAEGLKREVLVREFAQSNLVEFLKIAIETLEGRELK